MSYQLLIKFILILFMGTGSVPSSEFDVNICSKSPFYLKSKHGYDLKYSDSNETDDGKRTCSKNHQVQVNILSDELRPNMNALHYEIQMNCSNAKDDEKEFTVVTALFDLGRSSWKSFPRLMESYLAYSIPLLSMEIPIVIYATPQIKPFIEQQRMDKKHITEIRIIDLESLDFSKKYGQWIRDVMKSEEFLKENKLLNHPEGFSPEYNILMNSKIWLLNETANKNPFNTSHFFWLDIGYGHGHDVYPKDCSWKPKKALEVKDQITYIAVNNLSQVISVFQLYKQKVGPALNGAFFGGTQSAIHQYIILYEEVIEEFLSSEMIDDDQTLAVECYLRNSELFNIKRGNWYDVFTLFS